MRFQRGHGLASSPRFRSN